MADSINIKTFVEYLTHILKMTCYINKGTDQDHTLDRCIKLHNKYKMIEQAIVQTKELTSEDDVLIKKSIKRFNLILKVNSDGTPVDVRVKENQLKIVELTYHPAISSGDMKEIIEWAESNEILILPDVPMMFMLRQTPNQELLWQYLRALFFITQILVVTGAKKATTETSVRHQEVLDDAMTMLGDTVGAIEQLEETIEINKLMTLDNFLNSKLVKTAITTENVSDAKNEVKEIFKKKGLADNGTVNKMIENISSKLTEVDLSKGNIIQSMFGIAQSVAQDIRGDLENNPEQFHQTLGAITEVFQDAMTNQGDENEIIPAELKDIFSNLLAASHNDPNLPPTEEEIENLNRALDELAKMRGMTRDELLEQITDTDGQIDPQRFNLMMNDRTLASDKTDQTNQTSAKSNTDQQSKKKH